MLFITGMPVTNDSLLGMMEERDRSAYLDSIGKWQDLSQISTKPLYFIKFKN